MYRSKGRMTGRTRKLIIGFASVALAGGAFAVATGVSSAGENCAGLDQALQNNLNFIAGQKANPDSQSEARIANRQAVVDLINQRRVTAGCTEEVVAQGADQQAPADKQGADQQAPADKQGADQKGADQQAPADEQAPADNGAGKDGDVVCDGSTVTVSGEGGDAAASSNEFPIGTTLKVTNLDNDKSTTVKVTSVSGSCVLLNTAAFEQVREAGKFLIRRAVIERVG
jgi:hypothetical protein